MTEQDGNYTNKTVVILAGPVDHGRRSVGDGGTRPPLFRAGDSIGIVPPTFQFRKIAKHNSLTQHSSLLNAGT